MKQFPKFKAEKTLAYQALRRQVTEIHSSYQPSKIPLSGILFFTLFLIFLSGYWFLPIPFQFYSIILAGITTLPLVLTVGHESIHNQLSKSKSINAIGSYIFYFLGTSTYFWRIRHLNSHHSYSNIKDWDTDIEQTKLIRLSKHEPHKTHHRFQHFYMPILFLLYTLNWFFFRDFKDLVTLNIGNKATQETPKIEIFNLIIAKIWHLSFLIIIPYCFGSPFLNTVIGFFLFHITASATTTLVLISTHIGEEQEIHAFQDTQFEHSWVEHQIKSTADFSTNSLILLHFFGGFNHHLAHHLFPNIPYQLYPKITPLIKQFCIEKNLQYIAYSSIFECAFSHLKRLKQFSKS